MRGQNLDMEVTLYTCEPLLVNWEIALSACKATQIALFFKKLEDTNNTFPCERVGWIPRLGRTGGISSFRDVCHLRDPVVF